MKSIEYDLRYMQAGLDILEDYLLSEDVFWPLGANPPAGEPEYPQLTLDWMLLRRKRLVDRQVNDEQKDQVDRVVSELDLQRSKWRVAWEKKARQCYQVRLRMWGDFLNKYQENPPDNADRYAYEVRMRVMLELLSPEINHVNKAEAELLAGLDVYLKSVLLVTGFIWEPEIQEAFPREVFWYLYGELQPSARKH